jgi:hypothetical protein
MFKTFPNNRVENRPTGKSFEVDFCAIGGWYENGQIIEENLLPEIIIERKYKWV